MLKEIISYSRSFEDFLKNCTDRGIECVYTPQNKVKLKFRLSGEGQQRFTRADTLGDEFEPKAITETIDTAQKKADTDELKEKFFAAHRARREAELALLNQSSAKPAEHKTTSSAPTESQAPEKKKDVWAAIRGMRDSDKIVADLEAGGIASFSDLSGFFWNTHHADDYTDELAALNKKIMSVDKLIKMMKQRSQHSAIYKEYQERSAFTQKHFRKKNAAAIVAYEEADKYITEHIKAYYVDGKAPKRSELAALSKQLKDKRKAIMPEHKAYLLKHDMAFRYTRQVRQYLNEQYMKREREKSRQRTQAKRRNKNALE